ncbi:hypothetical protein RhiJN_27650 [Ceratobasidium sp. AG-Ba]|nr:hypothetical protein RhiJN_27650 [Ceratobasidium sp. AG-Ba]QRW14164.1 hypothetical protein RhiLY_13163 [Ceratobasidium sp. AG-Ba]
MVHIPELEVLNFNDMDATGMIHLLPNVLCTRPNLPFEANCYDNPEVTAATTALMGRTQIDALALWFDALDETSSLEEYFSSLKSLKMLVLSLNCEGIQPVLDALLLPLSATPGPRFPDLSRILFISARLDSQTVVDLQVLVKVNSIDAIDFVDLDLDERDGEVNKEFMDEVFITNLGSG